MVFLKLIKLKYIKPIIHILDLKHFGAKKVIAILSVKDYNEKAEKRGVKKVIEKDLADIDVFAKKVVDEISKMIRKIKN